MLFSLDFCYSLSLSLFSSALHPFPFSSSFPSTCSIHPSIRSTIHPFHPSIHPTPFLSFSFSLSSLSLSSSQSRLGSTLPYIYPAAVGFRWICVVARGATVDSERCVAPLRRSVGEQHPWRPVRLQPIPFLYTLFSLLSHSFLSHPWKSLVGEETDGPPQTN